MYLWERSAIPNYNVMGLAKASLEANVRYMANAMGPEGFASTRHLCGSNPRMAASGIKTSVNALARVKPLRQFVAP